MEYVVTHSIGVICTHSRGTHSQKLSEGVYCYLLFFDSWLWRSTEDLLLKKNQRVFVQWKTNEKSKINWIVFPIQSYSNFLIFPVLKNSYPLKISNFSSHKWIWALLLRHEKWNDSNVFFHHEPLMNQRWIKSMSDRQITDDSKVFAYRRQGLLFFSLNLFNFG